MALQGRKRNIVRVELTMTDTDSAVTIVVTRNPTFPPADPDLYDLDRLAASLDAMGPPYYREPDKVSDSPG